MGLLTNTKTRKKLVHIVSRYNNHLCVLTYVCGLVWFLALAHRPFNAQTYFSENALLPGLVEANFHHEHGASDILSNLKKELREIEKTDPRKEKINRIPATWLENQFRSLGLDVYVQNYTFKYPASIVGDHIFHGQNVYGILRAPKVASTEAIVLSAPYRPPDYVGEKTNNGIALMMALARSFRQHTYWAKDIVFLVTEHELIGMQAWLGSYHSDHNEYIAADELHGRSGSIQAALNLELGIESVHRLNIKVEGLNGQLPNLDLINTVVRLCRRESVTPALQKRVDPWDTESLHGFKLSLQNMVTMMMRQAPGSPTGNHGLFHRYHIEAVTLQGVRLRSSRPGAGYREVGRVIEGVCRSLNNLLERFHQSFFFYLLPATDRYVSIGLYMPPFGLLALPIVIKALALYIDVSFGDEEQAKETNAKNDGKNEAKKTDTQHETKQETEGNEDDEASEDTAKKDTSPADPKSGEKEKDVDKRPGLLSLIPTCIMAVFFGLAALNGPRYFMDTGRPFKMKPTDALFWGALALQVSSMLFPTMLKRKADKRGDVQGPDLRLLKCVALLAAGVVVGAVSLMNISLAFLVTAVWTPIFLLTCPTKYRLLNWVQCLLLIVVSPLGLLYFCNLALATTESSQTIGDLHLEAWEAAQTGLMTAIVEGGLLGGVTYSLITLAGYPVWLLFWSLMWTEPR